MLFHELQIFRPGVEAEDVARALDDQVDQHASIDRMIVEDRLLFLDERPIQCAISRCLQQNAES